jgi:outer membrane cobalamin receptor
MYQTKKLISFFINFSIFQFLSAVDFTLTVYNKYNLEPIEKCVINIVESNQIFFSDSNGSVKINFAGAFDSLHLSITAVAYMGKTVVIKPVENQIYKIYLEPTEEAVNEVIVTSARTNSRIEDLPTRVEVLGIEDVNEENGIKPGNITSLLGDIAGIQMQQTSASSGNTFARIQGLNGRYTQILKDGMPLYIGMSGSFGIMQIPPLDLKQIEIIKGSVSTLYGGDAIGGIINLVSKDPGNKPEMAITLNQSTLKETNANFYTARKFKKFGFTLFGGLTYENAVDVNKDKLSDVPWIRSAVIHPKLQFYLNKKTTITLNYTATIDTRKGGDMDYFSGFADSLYHVLNNIIRQNADIKMIHEKSKNERFTLKFSGSEFGQKTDTRIYDFVARQRLFYSEFSWFKKYEKSNWVCGVNINGDQFKNDTNAVSVAHPFPSNYHYYTLGIFAQNTWNPIKQFTMETGFRMDYHSKLGTFPLPRISFMYKFNPFITARINGGLGYKIPTPSSYINLETDITALKQNFSLKAETSTGINADVNFHKSFSKKFQITFNQAFFYTQLNSPVSDTSTTAGIKALANNSRPIITEGLQSYANLAIGGWEIYAGYVFTHVRKLYDVKNQILPVTPRHNLSAIVVREISDLFSIGIESSYIAGQVDQNYKPVKNYVLMAAMIRCKFKNFIIVLNGENLLDFRQNKYGNIYDGTLKTPVFHTLWAPIDGRVINLSVKYSIL